MKKILFFLAACANLFSAIAQQPFVCSEPGTVLEYACYDKKGRLTGYRLSTVESCERNVDGWLEVRTREQELDIDRNPVVKKDGTGDMRSCIVIRADDMILPLGDILASCLPDPDLSVVQIEGNEYACPLTLSVGMDLPDLSAVYNVYNDGEPTKMNVQFSVTDRKVLAYEKITVPVGTFDAYKVTETVSVKVLFIRVTRTAVTWRVPGVGDVRSEESTTKGKLESYMELVSIQRPTSE